MTAAIDHNSVSNKNRHLLPNNDSTSSGFFPSWDDKVNATKSKAEASKMDVFGTSVLEWDPWGGASMELGSDDEEKEDNDSSNNRDDLDKEEEEDETVRVVKTKINTKKVVGEKQPDDTDTDNYNNNENGEDGTVPLRDNKDNDDTKGGKIRSSSSNSSKGRGRRILTTEEVIMKRRSRSGGGNHIGICTDNISRRSRSKSIQTTAADFDSVIAPTITNQIRRSRRRQPEGQDQTALQVSRHQRSQSRLFAASGGEKDEKESLSVKARSTSTTNKATKITMESIKSPSSMSKSYLSADTQKRVYGSDSKKRRSSVKAAVEHAINYGDDDINTTMTLDTHGSGSKNRRPSVKYELEQFLCIDFGDDDSIDDTINTTTLDTQSEHISSSSKPSLRSRERRIGGKKPSRSSGNQSVASAPTASVAAIVLDDNNISKTKIPPRSKSHGPSRQCASLSKPTTPIGAKKLIGIEIATTPNKNTKTTMEAKKSPSSMSKSYLSADTQRRVYGSDSKKRRSSVKYSLEQCLPLDYGDDDDGINININTMTLDTQSEHISTSSRPKLRSRELRKGGRKLSSSGNRSIANADNDNVNNKDKNENKYNTRCRSRGPSHQGTPLAMPRMQRRASLR
jgi:hypothetical protein